MNKKKEWISLILGFIGTMIALIGVRAFNINVLYRLSMASRMISAIEIYFLIALVPVIIMVVTKDRFKDYGFSKEKVPMQILTGILLALGMSLILTVIPHLAGYGYYVSTFSVYNEWWRYLYELVYDICAIALVEEFVFRGFIYTKVKNIFGGDIQAVVISSILFGLFHIFNGNVYQVIVTGLIGALLCVCRLKIKNCSTLSLIIAHGLYDFLIVVFTAVFM
ncbi:MAG: CPBP family intramembrane metalloprotease [Clostridia bacterium]|nr:CPBP family intramembrane metalloprotease [Clostridia bacterium]